MNQSTLVCAYEESYSRGIERIRLSDYDYGRALQSIVPATVDVVVVDRVKELFYLAQRVIKPMEGWWWMGGRMYPDETPHTAILRKFREETSVSIDPDRLMHAAVFNYRWKDREQEPQDIGCQTIAHVFAYDATDEERERIATGLCTTEYAPTGTLRHFNREELIREGVHQAVLDLYTHLFPSVESVECDVLERVSSDPRRDLYEYTFRQGTFNHFYIKQSDLPLGNHFHRSKFEVFYFLKGGGVIHTVPMRVDGTYDQEDILMHTVTAGTVIRIPPRQVHRFDLHSDTEFVAYSSECFNPADMITCMLNVTHAR